jgi:hypothetical protein
MRFPDENLITPIYVKTRSDMSWPQDKVFYLLTSTGLFLCRNHPFFCSSVPTRSWPAELGRQGTFLELQYPRVPQALLELAVGFFAEIGERHGAEAAVVLALDQRSKEVRLMVPKQSCTVYKSWTGSTVPIGVNYELPDRLPEGWILFGDIHSHVDGVAFSSYTDKQDEQHRPGLHIVVGRIYDEPPEFHVEAIVDGVRFNVEQDRILDGYYRRREPVPDEWFEKVEIQSYDSYRDYWDSVNGDSGYGPAEGIRNDEDHETVA